jgi:tyrosine-protein kinase Etk/Wzc
MNDTGKKENSEQGFIWAFFEVIIRWRRLLLTNAIFATVLTLIILLFMANWYTASISILPPSEDNSALGLLGGMLPSGLGSLLGGSSGMSLPGLSTPSDLYAAILKSRLVCYEIIQRYNLQEVFGEPVVEKALMRLQEKTAITVEPEGIISLSYEDKDPVRAAAIANSYMEILNKVNTENIVTKARFMREFIEGRLNETIRDLTTAEEAYKNFQQTHKMLALDEQVKAAIGAMAELRSQLVIAEIEFGVMKKTLSPENSRYKEQEYKIGQIKNQLAKMEQGDPDDTVSSMLTIPVNDTPDLGLQLARLTRDLKIQETIFELLKQQYEQAKIQELKDTPTIQILDKADVPHIKSRPKRVTLSVLAGFSCFILTLFFVLAIEFVQREKQANTVTYQRIQTIVNTINDDYFWIKGAFTKRRNNDS